MEDSRTLLDINGNDARNYINSRGKKQGRNKAQFNAVTHFKILKRKEMLLCKNRMNLGDAC